MTKQTSATVTRLPVGTNQPLPPREKRDWVVAPELVEATGITYRQFDYWIRTGLLTTCTRPTPGSGHLRRIPEEQVQRAAVIKALLDAGVSLQTVRRVIDEITDTGRAELGPVTLTYRPTQEAS